MTVSSSSKTPQMVRFPQDDDDGRHTDTHTHIHNIKDKQATDVSKQMMSSQSPFPAYCGNDQAIVVGEVM